VNVTKWRNREAAREREIIVELAKSGDDVVFGGDTNDELGFQEFEQQAGGDSIAIRTGTDGKVVLATKELADKNEISFGGYFNDRYRSFIDHMFVSASLAGRVKSVSVYKDGLATVASDHYPVVMVIESK
jgi:endonuclease/exonuclease/phosphatase family metal-dependent hydrolase